MSPLAGPSEMAAESESTGLAPARVGLLADREFVEVRFGGSGGQGVVLMGMILAVAANYDRRCVVQTESYGPEARGGFSRSDVIISDEPIDYPKLDNADLFVALSQASANAYTSSLRPDGILIYDSQKVADPPVFSGTRIGMPFVRWATEETGRPQPANVLALGVMGKITGVVSVESLQRAVAETVPAGTVDVNTKALARGLAVEPADWQALSQR
jgi:2-oxoglutarate ferredoxin oxidoreductase subunit gamma